MNTNTLTRIATITAIIAGVSLLIAGVIGAASGAFRAIAAGGFRFNEAVRAGCVAVDERKSLPIAGINHIVVNAVSENITIREGSGESVMAWFHGNVSSADRPHLQVNQRGDTAEIRIERPHHIHMAFGSMYNDAVLEVGIPQQYVGDLSAESVSADVTLGSHDYAELALTTTSGDIEAGAMKAGSLTLRTTSGDVRVRGLATERAEIYSVSGDIHVTAFTGDVEAHSISGGVARSPTKTPGSIAVETVSGDIRLGMPPSAEFTLDAHSTSGGVTCGFPITVTNSHAGGEHSLAGAVGSGKGAVTVRTVSGDITITREGGK